MRLLVLFLLSILLVPNAKADTTDVYRDSIFAKYMKRGAWQEPIFSHRRIALTDSALKYLPHDAYLWQQRSMPFIKQMKYEISIQYMDSAVKYDWHKYIGYRGFLKCVFQKDYAGALNDLRLAKDAHPEGQEMDHPYDYWMGLCYLQLCQYDSAEMRFQLCVDLDKSVAGDWGPYLHTFYLGVAQFEREKFDEAMANFDLTLARHKAFADAKYYKALCLSATQQREPALTLMEQSLSDLKKGHSFSEDSSPYERYPYQISMWLVEGGIARLKK
jgi:tetratricopeptide (TPR) repeat protein